MLAIVMSDGVYCPLSPRDPEQRLHALLRQTEARVVLVHHLTKTNFNNEVIAIDIDEILTNNHLQTDLTGFSSTSATPESIAYIIFTSGSTGTPKGVNNIRGCSSLPCDKHLLFYFRLVFDIETSLTVCILSSTRMYSTKETLSFKWPVVHLIFMLKISWEHS